MSVCLGLDIVRQEYLCVFGLDMVREEYLLSSVWRGAEEECLYVFGLGIVRKEYLCVFGLDVV